MIAFCGMLVGFSWYMANQYFHALSDIVAAFAVPLALSYFKAPTVPTAFGGMALWILLDTVLQWRTPAFAGISYFVTRCYKSFLWFHWFRAKIRNFAKAPTIAVRWPSPTRWPRCRRGWQARGP